jgi:hypothetical protein
MKTLQINHLDSAGTPAQHQRVGCHSRWNASICQQAAVLQPTAAPPAVLLPFEFLLFCFTVLVITLQLEQLCSAGASGQQQQQVVCCSKVSA